MSISLTMTLSSRDRASLSPPRNFNAFAGIATPKSAMDGIAKRSYPASSGDARGVGRSPDIQGAQAGTGPALSCSFEEFQRRTGGVREVEEGRGRVREGEWERERDVFSFYQDLENVGKK